MYLRDGGLVPSAQGGRLVSLTVSEGLLRPQGGRCSPVLPVMLPTFLLPGTYLGHSRDLDIDCRKQFQDMLMG